MNQHSRAVVVRCGKLPFHAASPLETLNRNLTLTNVGNLLFQHAFIRSIYSPDTQIIAAQDGMMTDQVIDKINQSCSAVYLPFANAFRPSFRRGLQNWTAIIRKLKVPVVVVGIGAQCTSDDPKRELAEINDDVRKFCRAVLEKSASIGVRGHFTQRYLKELGIESVDVIGCPSMFYHGGQLPSPSLAEPDSWRQIAFHFSPQSPANLGAPNTHVGGHLDALLSLFRSLPDARCTYIAQDSNELNERIWGIDSVTLGSTFPLLKGIATSYPIDTHVWLRDLAGYDLVIGTRIHGTIAAIQAGVPSVILCHDSRTRELAEWFSIPSIEVDGASGSQGLSAQDVLQALSTSKMSAVFKSRFDTYLEFLNKNGVEHELSGPDGLNPHWNGYQENLDLLNFPGSLDNQRTDIGLVDEKINHLFRMLLTQQQRLSALR